MASSQVELQSVQDELTAIIAAITIVQRRLTDVIRRSSDESRTVQERIEELERDGQATSQELEGIWALNQELQDARTNPEETERAVDARNAAIRKLHRARKVIHDLMEERRTGLDVEYAAIIRGAQEGEASGSHRPASPSLPEGERSNRSHSGSEETVRQENVSPDVQENPSATVLGQENAEGLQTRSVGRLSNGTGTGPPNDAPVLTQSPEVIAIRTGHSSSSSPDVWSIHYSQRPSSAALVLGPMAWDLLATKLRLSDEVMASLKKLEKIQQHGPRIQVVGNAIFVYDSIILNGPSASYLIEWGSRKIIERAQRYVNATGDTPAYHTFLFPVKKGGWYYVGKMVWTVANMWLIWPTLSARSKAKLTAKLRDRCGKREQKDEITRMMDQGGLEQLCFELRAETPDASRAFATEMGFVPGDVTEVEA